MSRLLMYEYSHFHFPRDCVSNGGLVLLVGDHLAACLLCVLNIGLCSVPQGFWGDAAQIPVQKLASTVLTLTSADRTLAFGERWRLAFPPGDLEYDPSSAVSCAIVSCQPSLEMFR